jgi:nucleotide-binding universal stress UspA family protein
MYKKILVPLDMEERSLNARAIAIAEDLAAHYGAALTALTAIPNFSDNPLVASYFPDDAAQKAYGEACRDFKRLIDARFSNPGAVDCAIVEGSPRKEIVKYVQAHGFDLVVMPARKNDISKVLLGSNSAHVADHAPCSVLIVRP